MPRGQYDRSVPTLTQELERIGHRILALTVRIQRAEALQTAVDEVLRSPTATTTAKPAKRKRAKRVMKPASVITREIPMGNGYKMVGAEDAVKV